MTWSSPPNRLDVDHPDVYVEPRILYHCDTFLTKDEISHYQTFMLEGWKLPDLDRFKYISRDLYNHYRWDGDWSSVGWRDDCPPDWEILYKSIAVHLPAHRVHWVDLKITPPLSTGVPLHRDLDPWAYPSTVHEFSRAITVLCNLNTEWQNHWGGDFVLHQAVKQDHDINYEEKYRIPIKPGQLLITENCFHSMDPVIEPERNRISFILHALQYL